MYYCPIFVTMHDNKDKLCTDKWKISSIQQNLFFYCIVWVWKGIKKLFPWVTLKIVTTIIDIFLVLSWSLFIGKFNSLKCPKYGIFRELIIIWKLCWDILKWSQIHNMFGVVLVIARFLKAKYNLFEWHWQHC
jgi:hypothetical protein